MTTSIQALVDQSNAAWENWNNLGFEKRITQLTQWSSKLESDVAAMVAFQCRNANAHVAETELMPGPTGETNELYCAGRGIFVVTADADTPLVAVAGQLTAALVTGNTVLLCLPEGFAKSAQQMVSELEQAELPKGVVLPVSADKLDDIVRHTAVAGVVYAGKRETALSLSRDLAARDGLLGQLIAESDFESYPVIGSPTYSLRFVTERTRTINITAVGGNATLLELGSGEEVH
ncbi:aldehyde dehydrogenase family protein [Photobacterium sp. CCB-ST2H9]|uniref:aldehyde dehydrogenase family protein n=1 Tax=unclassified Photobacterium TaxID=2628852 RepID=UPI002005E035|nr:aldehyde dehydrogenase family protein [Photobacterium sp. CCB-ST2H9]UTM59465.1 aldehyde dehydrogenase family protein [Photobacterium sp. CCB-ST2H9]